MFDILVRNSKTSSHPFCTITYQFIKMANNCKIDELLHMAKQQKQITHLSNDSNIVYYYDHYTLSSLFITKIQHSKNTE